VVVEECPVPFPEGRHGVAVGQGVRVAVGQGVGVQPVGDRDVDVRQHRGVDPEPDLGGEQFDAVLGRHHHPDRARTGPFVRR
jgi:hypothetical protein